MKNIVLSLFLIVISFAACKKSSTAQFKIKLTDAPYNASEVNVEITQVSINMRDDSTGWTILPTQAGVYDLLKLQNNVQATLASGTVANGTVKEIRFALGTNNSIVIDSVKYPLLTTGKDLTGLKIKVSKSVANSIDSLVIDFDAELSIKKKGNEYKLAPVLKLK
jgi:hypothetical protein